MEAASAKAASAVETTAAAKAASAVAAATKAASATTVATAAAAATATAGQGNVRRKHANRGSCEYGYDRFAQHDCAP
jgi:hypothetical protein